jgi:cell division protein FtsI/penicillin-binding protein 2
MSRLRTILLFYLICIFAITGKLFYIQAFSGEEYSPNNYLQTERIEPARGQIFDRNGEPFVINEARYLLYAEPLYIKDKDEFIYKIDKVLKIGEATLEAKLDTKKQWVRIESNLTESQKKSLDKLKLSGIGFEEHSERFYPEASLAAHLLGFVGKDNDGDDIGYFGIEGYYNKDLEGLPGIFKTERDVLGRPIFIGTQDRLKGENGRKLILTIDKRSQSLVKRKLLEGIEKYEAKSGCILVAKPSTMEILAMSCLPDFAPHEYYDYSETDFKNPIISNAFEPGSIFKPLIVAAALEEKKIKPDDIIDETGPIKFGGHFIRTWNNEYHGKITVTKVLQNSSNVGMVQIGQKMDNKTLLSYIKDYGFGEQTGIDLQGEVRATVKPYSQWYPIDFAAATFGQGIAVTPIQMMTGFASIINGGYVMKPYVVKEMVSESGKIEKVEPKKVRQIINEKNSRKMRAMLEAVVKGGEVHWKVPEGYRFGGKTGTAQIAFEGSYDASKTNASFIGFAPVDDPQFIMLVMLHEPAASPWASETAAPLFFDVAKDLLVQYNISPR